MQVLSNAETVDFERELALAIAITEAYQSHQQAHPAWREAMCLKAQFPGRLGDLRAGDLFAGRKRAGAILIFSPQVYMDRGDQCGYCFELGRIPPEAAARPEAQRLVEFWGRECTRNKVLARLDPEILRHMEISVHPRPLPPGAGRMGQGGTIRLAGLMLDFDRLLQAGLPGLKARVIDRQERACREGAGPAPLFDAMRVALDVVADACLHYRDQARALAASADDDGRRRDLLAMADALDALPRRAPQTFREAAQLFWIYGVVADVYNYSRMDVYLGDFFARDLDRGTLSETEAHRLLCALWRLMDETQRPWDTRVFIGGRGRRNPAAADRFALAAMEATRAVHRTMPQLTLRLDRAQDPVLLDRALDVLAEGCQFPSLYNDDTLVPAMQRLFKCTEAEAEQYLPLGCGEMTLGHHSVGSPNTVFTVAKALEAALHGGCDGVTGEPIGPRTGSLASFTTFDALVEAFRAQVRFMARLFARYHACELAVEACETAFLHASLLLGDSLERGRPMLDGGCRYRGGCVEGFGFTNTGDSLAAIRELVYERQVLSLDRLVAALDADFAGYEKERALMLACPKYGNDVEAVDALVAEVSNFASRAVMEAGREAGLDYLILSNVNPGGYALGAMTAASADGRKRAEPFALGNSPTAGRDRSGPTAMLRSVTRPDPANGGVTTNLKISSETFTAQRPKVDALMKTYFATGGVQANLTVVRRGELEQAMVEPEKYRHVLVRLAGYSVRFVNLDPVAQREIIARTLY